MARTATLTRKTNETDIALSIDLDGTGTHQLQTGVGFFDHMLTHLAKHGLFDLEVKCDGDLHIDAHHSVEDVGIALGQCLSDAVGDKKGIRRFGQATVPMDEALASAYVDLSGRPFLVWNAAIPLELLGNFSSQLAEEFWRAMSSSGRFTLHVMVYHGHNTHHIIEAIFKAVAQALRQAIEIDPRQTSIPSTKGVL